MSAFSQGSRVCIYQLFVRVFGNTHEQNAFTGDLTVNGSGKFSSINAAAIAHVQALGMTHVWLTGVIRHATLSAYPELGLPADDPDIVKGKAGSPYAITDYYDVDPDLADDPARRLEEFDALVARLHGAGLKVLLDFIPNHVSRAYQSVRKPAADFGSHDDQTTFFSPRNDFFYLVDPPGQRLQLTAPAGWDPGGLDGVFPREDGAIGRTVRATGNNVARCEVSPFDWYETVKLNYGYNFVDGTTCYEPPPPVWDKMNEILAYWQGRGVDGFRCDFAHWVPVEFWAYVTERARQRDPRVFFLAEAYDNDDGSAPAGSPPNTTPHTLLTHGGFDAAYDHFVFGISRGIAAGVNWANDFDERRARAGPVHGYARYAENHDERRAASPVFPGAGPGDTGYGSGPAGLAATAAITLASSAPVLLYAGQEVGETATDGPNGYSGEDGRTTIFDYWSPPMLRKLHQARYEGDALPPATGALLLRYRELFRLANDPACQHDGCYYGLNGANKDQASFGAHGHWLYAFLRYVPGTPRALLVVVNLHPSVPFAPMIRVPALAMEAAWGKMPESVRITSRRGTESEKSEKIVSSQALASGDWSVQLSPHDYVVWELESFPQPP